MNYCLEWRALKPEMPMRQVYQIMVTNSLDGCSARAAALAGSDQALDGEFRLTGPDGRLIYTRLGELTEWRPGRDPLPRAAVTAWLNDLRANARRGDLLARLKTILSTAVDYELVSEEEADRAATAFESMLLSGLWMPGSLQEHRGDRTVH